MPSDLAAVDGLVAEATAPDDGRGWRVAILVGVIFVIWALTFGPGAARQADKLLREWFSGAAQRRGKGKGSTSGHRDKLGDEVPGMAASPQASGSHAGAAAANARQRRDVQQQGQW